MDLARRNTFLLGALGAAVVGSIVGVAATREDDEEAPAQPQPAIAVAAPTIVAPTVTVQTPIAQPTQGSCMLPDVPTLIAGTVRPSSAISLSPDERSAAVADTDNHGVVMLAIDGERAVVRSRFTTGQRPSQVLLSRDGRAFVTERGSGTVSVFDPRDGRKLCTTQVAADPVAMALSSDGSTLYVTSGLSAKLTAIDTQRMSKRWSVDVPREPRGVALSADGSRAVLAHVAGAPLSVVDLNDESHRSRAIAAPPVPAERQVFQTVSAASIASARPSLRDSIGFRGRHGFMMQPVAQQQSASVTPLPSQAYAMVSDPQSGEIIMPFMVNRTGQEVPPEIRQDRYGGGSVSQQRQDEKVSFAVGVFDPVTERWKSFHMPQGFSRQNRRAGFFRGSSFAHAAMVRIPVALARRSVDGALLVASLGTSELATISLPTTPALVPTQSLGSARRTPIAAAAPSARAETEPTLAAPSGVATTEGGLTLVYSAFDHAVEVRKGASRTRVEVSANPLAPDVARGRQLFFTANDPRLSSGGLSCGGCHPDTRDDGLVWFLQQGPRQTPMLAGRMIAPFNWSGSHRTAEGNIAQTVTRLGGTGLTLAEVDAIAAFLNRGIDAPAPPSATESAPATHLAERGRTLFSGSANCASCHDPARNFTDGMPHEVGGLRADERERNFDTPSLRFVRATGPWFHDGRYASLRSVLTDSASHMGTAGSLPSDEVDAIEAYLQTL